MFSLIITIISIALVTALALATIYYGGTAFTEGSDNASAARLINEGQQLQGAYTLAKANVVDIVNISDLVDNGYLSQLPGGWSIVASEFVTTATVNDAVCEAINDKSGQLDGQAALAAGVVYGCTSDNLVRYKF